MKKFLSLLLVITLMLAMVPMQVNAAGTGRKIKHVAFMSDKSGHYVDFKVTRGPKITTSEYGDIAYYRIAYKKTKKSKAKVIEGVAVPYATASKNLAEFKIDFDFTDCYNFTIYYRVTNGNLPEYKSNAITKDVTYKHHK